MKNSAHTRAVSLYADTLYLLFEFILTDFSPHHLRAEVGIVLLPSFHRKGIATEALHQIALYATEHLHLATLYAYVAENNTAAQALFRRAGYTIVANLPHWIEGRHSATLFLLHL